MDSAPTEATRVLDITGNTDVVAAWYYLIRQDDRHKKIFYADEGQQDILSVLNWSKRLIKLYGVFSQTGPVLGLGWVENEGIYNLKDGPVFRAEMGFGFTSQATIFQALESGRRMIDNVFNDLKVEFIFGTTPTKNREAVAYIKRLGLSLNGPIPNYCSYLGEIDSVYISQTDRKTWNGKERTGIHSKEQ